MGNPEPPSRMVARTPRPPVAREPAVIVIQGPAGGGRLRATDILDLCERLRALIEAGDRTGERRQGRKGDGLERGDGSGGRDGPGGRDGLEASDGLEGRLPQPGSRSSATREPIDCDVSALVSPDLGTVDALARLALTARRLGRPIRLLGASAELQDLLEFAGLAGVVPWLGRSGFEAGREAEERKEPRGVEEEGDPADPAV